MRAKDKRNVLTVPLVVCIILLLIAIQPIEEYGYYFFLRWMVTIVAAIICYMSYEQEKRTSMWIAGIIAVLFNPVIPIHLDKEIWKVIDMITAGVFCIFVIIFLIPKKEKSVERYSKDDENFQ